MQTSGNATKASHSSSSSSRSKTLNAEAPFWIRMGLPMGCAALAAILNFAAIKRQIQPVKAYAIKASLPMGTRLQASNLTLIELAGNFDRTAVLLEKDLLLREGDSSRMLDLKESLERRPRILNRNSQAGEILVKSALGGTEGPRENEMVIEVPRMMISANDDFLMPGKIVHFSLVERGKRANSTVANVIGPFRISFEDRSNEDPSKSKRKDPVVSIAYGLTQNGQLTPSAVALQNAVADPTEYTLFALEARLRQPKSSAEEPTNVSVNKIDP